MDDLTSEGHDLLSSRVILSDDDFRRGCERPSDFKSGFYKDIDKLDSSYSWKIEKLDIKGSFEAKGRRTTFGKYLKEEHVTWAQFRKKRDKKATLQDFDGALDYSAWRRRHKSPLTPSKLEGYEVTIICDDVIIICDDVTIANLKKPIEDSAG
ncbi:hypothetical protein Tco_0798587 [Tanacetum coccineum]